MLGRENDFVRKVGPRETVGELVGLVCRPRGHRGFDFHYALDVPLLLGVPPGCENPCEFAVLASISYPFRKDSMPTEEQVYEALSGVLDPEIGKPITELDMVRSVTIAEGRVLVEVLLTVPGCPMKDRITRDVTEALRPVEGVTDVQVHLGVMTEEQRQTMVTR